MITDVNPRELCNSHLMALHRECHRVWNQIQKPERQRKLSGTDSRFAGNSRAIYRRHNKVVDEMLKRGLNHDSDLTGRMFGQISVEAKPELAEQIEMYRQKDCDCFKE